MAFSSSEELLNTPSDQLSDLSSSDVSAMPIELMAGLHSQHWANLAPEGCLAFPHPIFLISQVG